MKPLDALLFLVAPSLAALAAAAEDAACESEKLFRLAANIL